MEERALRSMIAEVKTGRMSRATSFRPWSARPDCADAAQMLGAAGVAQAQPRWRTSRPSAGRRALKTSGAGRDAPQPALRRRHQGSGRLAHLLRPLASWTDGNLSPVLAAEIRRRRTAGSPRMASR